MNTREQAMINAAHRVMAYGAILTSSDLPALYTIGNELGVQGMALILEVRQGPAIDEDFDTVKALTELLMGQLNKMATVVPESRIIVPE